MKTLLNVIGVVSIISVFVAVINLITFLVFGCDFCFYTLCPVSELGGTACTVIPIAIGGSFVTAFAWLGNGQ